MLYKIKIDVTDNYIEFIFKFKKYKMLNLPTLCNMQN